MHTAKREKNSSARVPASYLVNIAAHLLPDRDDLERLLTTVGLPANPGESSTLGTSQLLEAIAWLDARAPRGWHIEASLQLDASQHGAAGLAVVTAPEVDQALDALVSFESLRAPWSVLRQRRSRELNWLITASQLPDQGPRELLTEMTVLAQFSLLGQLGPSVRSQLQLVLPVRYRPWESLLHQALGSRLRFEGKEHKIGIPLDQLNMPCLLRDPRLHAIACQRCRDDLVERHGLGPLSQQVYQRLMETNSRQPPSLERLARQTGLSSRTLTRRLKAEGSNWRILREKALSLLAAAALREGRETIGQIAERLGYSDPANFNRACHRWWGCGPNHYRQHGQAAHRVADGR